MSQKSFKITNNSSIQSPELAIIDRVIPFNVVCDVTDSAIGWKLMQHDTEGAKRVVGYQLRLLKIAERKYTTHEKEPFPMKYAQGKSTSTSLETDRSSFKRN